MIHPDDIGTQLQIARLKSGTSKTDAAKALGVSERTLRNWENGTAMLGFDQALRLADLYGLSIGELAGDREHFVVLDTIRELTRQIEKVGQAVDDLKRGPTN